LLKHFLQNIFSTPRLSSTLVRRDTINQLGGFEETFRGMFEDQVFTTKVSIEADIFVSGECLSRYRQHPDSECSVVGKAGGYQNARLTFFEWVEQYLTRAGVRDNIAWSVLKKNLFKNRHPTLHRLFGSRGAILAMIPEPVKTPVRKLGRIKRAAWTRARMSLQRVSEALRPKG
jgi:hypothetical protein